MSLLRARIAAFRSALELNACDGRALCPEEHSQALVDLWHIDHEPAIDLDDNTHIADYIVAALACDHDIAKWAEAYARVGLAVVMLYRSQLVNRLDTEIKAAQARLDDERDDDADDYEAENATTNRIMDAERAVAMNREM